MNSNIVTAVFGEFREVRTRALYKWDYGQILRFEGLDLPDNYIVHFSNENVGGESVTMIGNADGVDIPNECLTTGKPVYAWVFLNAGADDGETVYSVIIPVKKRPRPCGDEPTPVQQGAIEQAIAALNTGVAAAQEAAQDAEQIASDLGDFDTAMRAVTAAKEEAAVSATNASTAAGEAADSAAEAAQTLANVRTEGAAQISAIDAEGQEVLDSIPADYADLSADVVELKSHTPSVETPTETEADLYICDSDGNVIAKFVDGNIVTKNFDSGAIQLDLIMDADSDEADLYIVDSFGNVVAEFKGGNIITKNFNSGDYADVLTDINTLLSDVAALKTATSGILYRTHDQTDGVYAVCRWHQPNSSSKQFCMLISGDIHTDPTRMLGIIEYLNAIDAFDAGVMLGDMSGLNFDSPITYYTDAIVNTQKPFLTVLGNHDVYGATSDADLWNKYGALFEYADLSSGEGVDGKCYYYKDFALYKIRVIVLMQYDIKFDSVLCFGQSQIDWFISTLDSTPSDYGVIICEHTNASRYMTYNMDAEYTSSTWKRTDYAPTWMSGDPVPDIINVWINGGTLMQTYSYNFDNPPADLSVNADFTARGAGEFITYLGGHWHMDVFGTPTAYTDQPDYHVPAAGLPAAIEGDIPRKAGTVSEDSFCVIGVDRDKKTVKIYHIGAHYTKDAVNRQYFKYSYGGSNA